VLGLLIVVVVLASFGAGIHWDSSTLRSF